MRQKLNLRPSFVICLDIFYSSIIKNWYWSSTSLEGNTIKTTKIYVFVMSTFRRLPEETQTSTKLLLYSHGYLFPELVKTTFCFLSLTQRIKRGRVTLVLANDRPGGGAFHFLITLKVWEWVDGWSTLEMLPASLTFRCAPLLSSSNCRNHFDVTVSVFDTKQVCNIKFK